ncbi:hypothetical protein OSB04_031438 [Centaurea solstitialis]|uniref:ATPase AAA-type core domain-containing protein n=1 Tax=Centaurea solstitialis TaxID=347529 RepID=A0AA38SM57_9ASTR|nr:hypothetical protein OSB04_031438 [Centaurea solstitialis]
MQRFKNQRSRPTKPDTIHVSAQSGDLPAVQKFLRENPALLNDRNPVVRNQFSYNSTNSIFLIVVLIHIGKTMVARILGKLLFMVGILPTDKVTEVQRTDLVGEFVGHTGPKTRRVVSNSYKGSRRGILFVDEAYRLIPMQKSDDKDYGLEALEEIMSVMDNGKVVVIFAGYTEPMKRVITSNEGFRRRVTKFFTFDDFITEDLAKILHMKMKNQTEGSLLYGFKLHPSCTVKTVANLIETEITEKQRKEMNGGLVDPLLGNARENLDLRLNFDCIDIDELVTITFEDLRSGIMLFSR